MCCDLQTHVVVIALIGIVFSGLSGIHWALTFIGLHHDITRGYEGNAEPFILPNWVQFLCSATFLFADICCLIGAIKRNKYLLIPFMIVNSLVIILLIGCAILLLIFGSMLTGADITQKIDNYALGLGFGLFFFVVIIPMSIALGLYIYFLIIVVKFYKAISSEEISTQQTGMVLQPFNATQYVQQGVNVSSCYVQPGTQNVTYAYQQQQPATYVYQQQPPTNPYIQQGYPTNNPWIKIFHHVH